MTGARLTMWLSPSQWSDNGDLVLVLVACGVIVSSPLTSNYLFKFNRIFDQVPQLTTDDFAPTLPRSFLKKTTFVPPTSDSHLRPMAGLVDKFVGISPQSLYDQLSVLRQVGTLQPADMRRLWQGSLVKAGSVLVDSAGSYYLVAGATANSAKAHRLACNKFTIPDLGDKNILECGVWSLRKLTHAMTL